MLFQVFLLSIILGFIIGFLVGGFIEWDKATQVIKELKSDLRIAYRETDDLYETIHGSSQPIRQARG